MITYCLDNSAHVHNNWSLLRIYSLSGVHDCFTSTVPILQVAERRQRVSDFPKMPSYKGRNSHLDRTLSCCLTLAGVSFSEMMEIRQCRRKN